MTTEPNSPGLEAFGEMAADDLSLNRLFAPLVGKPAWGIKIGHGGSLTMEFGAPRLKVREPIVASPGASARVSALLARRRVTVIGEWHLWIYCCDWWLDAGGHELANSQDKRGKLGRAANVLDGQLLNSAGISERRGGSVFRFDLGATLKTSPYDDGENLEQWVLHRPDGSVVSLLADGRLVQETGDTPVTRRNEPRRL